MKRKKLISLIFALLLLPLLIEKAAGSKDETITTTEGKQSYQDYVEMEVNKISSSIELLKEKAALAKDDVKKKWQASIVELESKRDQAKQALEAYKSASAANWKEKQDELQRLLGSLKTSFHQANDTILTQKEAFEEKAEAKLRLMDYQISHYREKSADQVGAAKTESDETRKKLDDLRVKAAVELGRVREASKETWQKLRTNTEKLLAEFYQTYERAVTKLGFKPVEQAS